MTESIRISEIFGPTIQGEGALIGQPTVFVRTGGCDYRCTWCDTLHAVDSQYRHDWAPMTTQDIWTKITGLSGGKPITVSLSGGNPAIHDFGALIRLGKRHGYRFALETQGSIAQDWFGLLDVLTLSPKSPSSGMKTDWDKLSSCIDSAGQDTRTILKIVIFDDADYAYAQDVCARHPALPVYLQPGNHTPPSGEQGSDDFVDMGGIMERMRWLVDKTVADGWFSASVLPQLHVLLWGNMRGV